MTRYVIKRIYDEPEKSDGLRVLVDRLWPRGVSKEKAELDEWCKTVAPSSGLRKWFGHEAKKFEEFAKLYREELKSNEELPVIVAEWKKHKVVTLVYAAHDPKVNHALVLRDFLTK